MAKPRILVFAGSIRTGAFSAKLAALVAKELLLLDADCLPVVPVQGSVGYLSHMAHIALALLGEGSVLPTALYALSTETGRSRPVDTSRLDMKQRDYKFLLPIPQPGARLLFVRQGPAERPMDDDRVSDRRQIAVGAVRHAAVIWIDAIRKRTVCPRGLGEEIAKPIKDLGASVRGCCLCHRRGQENQDGDE